MDWTRAACGGRQRRGAREAPECNAAAAQRSLLSRPTRAAQHSTTHDGEAILLRALQRSVHQDVLRAESGESGRESGRERQRVLESVRERQRLGCLGGGQQGRASVLARPGKRD